MDLPPEASCGDFNETIATRGKGSGVRGRLLRAEVQLLRVLVWRKPADDGDGGRRAAASLKHVDRGVSRAGVYAICLVLG